ncbi:NADH dehydrogenase [ubiquinone] iron-sulfur protein 5 [Halyomorpha halys]|uniref:NADH dehydrogenase [ubiquinone] iron-sulfur protein 5 n=1 Tax=Halyomorpha halys TaxID=286706 RepID=UPI0006D519DF|nr:uncharacterized protein LOC106682858 [Halyomorpha halys]
MPGVLNYFKTPLTDLTGTILTHQYFGRCQGIEMKAINCLEAYGQERGLKECGDLLGDYEECHKRFKQIARYEAIQSERRKQGVFEPAPRADVYED